MPLTLEITKRVPKEQTNVFVLDGSHHPASWFNLEQLTCCVPLSETTLASATNVVDSHPLGKRITIHVHVPSLAELEKLNWETLLVAGGTVRITVPPGATLPRCVMLFLTDTFVIAPECLDEPVALRVLSKYPEWHNPAALARAVADLTPYIADRTPATPDVNTAAP